MAATSPSALKAMASKTAGTAAAKESVLPLSSFMPLFSPFAMYF
jgi:hypothetical protein